jgi:hypothetical protein
MPATQLPSTLGYELAGLTAVIGLCLAYVLLLYLADLRRRRTPRGS